MTDARTAASTRPERPPRWILVLVTGGLVAQGLLVNVVPPLLALAVPVALIPALIALRAPRWVALVTLACVLPLLGIARRVTGSYTADIDPLTLVPPILAASCIVTSLGSGRTRPRTPLGGAVGVMGCIGLVAILNPLQGGPLVGLAGAGLFVGPLIWFYVGQVLGTEAVLSHLQGLLRIMAIVAIVYGTKQLVFGFASFEQAWITAREADYQALIISGSTRPFSIFTSGAEYSHFLSLGAVLCFQWKTPVGRAVRWPLVMGMLLASFYAGSRSIFVTGVAGVAILALVSRGWKLARALLVCFVLAVLGLAVLRLIPQAEGDSTAAKIRNRTLGGLADPLNPEVSTLGIHVEAVRYGLVEGLRNPVGQGAAVVNSAGKKFGTGTQSAEQDLPNALLAYGWAGGLALIVIIVRVYRLVGRAVASRRPVLFGPAVFSLTLFGAWFVGELYSVSALVWFFLGSLDRQLADPQEAESEAEEGSFEREVSPAYSG